MPRTQLIVSIPGLGFIAGVFQVLGFAAFFALVLKRVEDEEEPVASLPGRLSSPGNGAQAEAGSWNPMKLRQSYRAQLLSFLPHQSFTPDWRSTPKPSKTKRLLPVSRATLFLLYPSLSLWSCTQA